jgi:hypothetical protein
LKLGVGMVRAYARPLVAEGVPAMSDLGEDDIVL